MALQPGGSMPVGVSKSVLPFSKSGNGWLSFFCFTVKFGPIEKSF